MAFRYTGIGRLVGDDPEAAARELRRLVVLHRTFAAVARELGVDYKTMQRWFRRLEQAGHDPRAPEPPKG